MIHPDGKSGLFVFKREHYYPGKMGLLTATPDEYVLNVTIIGSYDIASGKVRVLHRRDNGKRVVYETNDFRFREIVGSRALVGGNDVHFNWLDINTGAMTPLLLNEELMERGRDMGQIHLVDEKGTLILNNPALGETINPTAPRELWVRRPNGEFERVVQSPVVYGSYGFKDNELYFYADRRCQIYNLESRTKRPCPNRDMPRMKNYDLTIEIYADEHGSPQPTIRRKVDGKWIPEEVRIDTSALR